MSERQSPSTCNTSLNLMGRRIGVFHDLPTTEVGKPPYSPYRANPGPGIESIQRDDVITGTGNLETMLNANGGTLQQERMIFDKRRSLDKAILYSYQGAKIRLLNETRDNIDYIPALINPDKNKMDYDIKILSVGFEHNIKPGDVIEWLGTKTHWLVCLQELTELAYFRGEIRKCSYEITYEDEDGEHTTFVSVRGPVETKINFIQKHQISVDEPNHSLHIYLPRTEENLKYFRRYSKFYLQGEDPGSPQICWRVEATDWISTPGILEMTAVEYYINETEDDLERGVVGGLVIKNVNSEEDNKETFVGISGDEFIKPRKEFIYEYKGPVLPYAQWSFDKKYPIEAEINDNIIKIKWKSNYSGQFVLSYGDYTKTIVVESLF